MRGNPRAEILVRLVAGADRDVRAEIAAVPGFLPAMGRRVDLAQIIAERFDLAGQVVAQRERSQRIG